MVEESVLVLLRMSLTHNEFSNYYSYAKRGQVLLAEEYTKLYPDIVTVSAHPGWTYVISAAF